MRPRLSALGDSPAKSSIQHSFQLGQRLPTAFDGYGWRRRFTFPLEIFRRQFVEKTARFTVPDLAITFPGGRKTEGKVAARTRDPDIGQAPFLFDGARFYAGAMG